MNTPKIRFKGFEDHWEQRKLNEIADVRDGTHDSPKYVQEGHPFITSKNVSNGFINYDEVQYITDVDYEEINKRSKVDVHDILMGMIGTIGNLALIRQKPDFAIKNVALIKYTGDVDYQYLYQTLQVDCVTRQLFTGMDGGTQKFVSLKKIRELGIPFTEEQEQQKIGQYFENLDNLITLHQRKCDETKQLKKFMLQNMFPKNGEKNPEIRFEGFTDDWEQRKLRENLSFLKDGTHGTHKDVEDGPLLLSAKNIKNGTVQWDESDRRISEDEFKSIHANFKLKEGDVLLTIVGSIGETAILNNSEGITFQRSVAFLRPASKIISEFLYSEIQGYKFQKELNERKSTSAQPGIYLSDLGEIPISYPINMDEQVAIGHYFTNIDHLITLHQRKCEKLKALKKFMLQNMFI